MKIQTDKQTLLTACHFLNGCISDRTMSFINMMATEESIHQSIGEGKPKGQYLAFNASDLILNAYSEVECEIIETGFACVSARLFMDIIKQLPDGVVHLSTVRNTTASNSTAEESSSESHSLKIEARSSSKFDMMIPLLENKTWQNPLIENKENSPKSDSFAIDSAKLGYMIEQVNYCISHDCSRNFGTVGYLHLAKDENASAPMQLRLVGTDGYRLAYCQVDIDSMPSSFLPAFEKGLCLSKRTLSELAKMCQLGFDHLNLTHIAESNTLMAQVDDYSLYIQLSSVQFPNYNRILTEVPSFHVFMDRGTLLSSLKRVLLASDKSQAVQFRFDESTLVIASKTIGQSEGSEEITIDSEKVKLNLTLNGSYLADILNVSRSDKIKLHLKDEYSQIYIFSVEEVEDCQSLHLFLPVSDNF